MGNDSSAYEPMGKMEDWAVFFEKTPIIITPPICFHLENDDSLSVAHMNSS
jgi:hypothetical protein